MSELTLEHPAEQHPAEQTTPAPTDALAAFVDAEIERALQAVDLDQIRQVFNMQEEFIALERLIPQSVIKHIAAEAERLADGVNRSRVPGYKKSGSVSYYTLWEQGPAAMAIYRSPALLRFLDALTSRELQRCPDDDPHACALYYYTEPGDRVGWHYDSSFYKGERFTVLLGLVESSSSKLQCRLYTKDDQRDNVDLELTTHPGTLVIFNGDYLQHQVTPLGEGERRIILTTEYVTDQRMGRFKRAISNVKDSMAYFGFRALFRKRPTRPPQG